MADMMRSPWLQRDSPALQNYMTVLFGIICIVEMVIASFIIFTVARQWKAQRSALTSGQPLSNEQITTYSARLDRTYRTIYKLAVFSMANVTFITLIDGYLCVKGLSTVIVDANTASSSGWDLDFIILITRSVLLDAVVFLSAFFLVPALQAVLAGYVLTKLTTGTDRQPLSQYILEAKAISVLLALMWSLICVGLSFIWPPMTDSVLLRYMFLESAWGSALMWLHASFVFIYRANKLADRELPVADAGLKKLVVQVGETVAAAHAWDEKKPLLPVAEKA